MRTMLRCDPLIIAVVIFIALIGIAMLVYPGGNFDNKNANSYSLNKNFLSDLGSTRAYDGGLNISSMILFIIAMVTLSLSFSLFTLNYKSICEKKGRLFPIGKITVFFGSLCGLSFIAVAAAPVNLYPEAHLQIQRIAFISLIIYMVLILVIQIVNGWSKTYLFINLAYVLLVFSYVGLMYFGPGIDTPDGLQAQALAQKTVILITVLNMLIQAYGIRRYVVTRDTSDIIP